MGVWLVLVAALGMAPARKPGLWQSRTKTTWQQKPTKNIPSVPTQTTKVCLTQTMMDRYGGDIPETTSSCAMTNVAMTPGGMTGELVCAAPMKGKASIVTTWSDDEHALTTIHFVGETPIGHGEPKRVEWTSKTTSVYKKADCGLVLPGSGPGE